MSMWTPSKRQFGAKYECSRDDCAAAVWVVGQWSRPDGWRVSYVGAECLMACPDHAPQLLAADDEQASEWRRLHEERADNPRRAAAEAELDAWLEDNPKPPLPDWARPSSARLARVAQCAGCDDVMKTEGPAHRTPARTEWERVRGGRGIVLCHDCDAFLDATYGAAVRQWEARRDATAAISVLRATPCSVVKRPPHPLVKP